MDDFIIDGVIFDDGNMKITAYHNTHMRPTEKGEFRSFSFHIEAENTSIAYSGDIRSADEMDAVIGDGCDIAITETGHFKIDDVHAYYADKNVGRICFSHNGREILNDPAVSNEEVKLLFSGRAFIAEDGMCVEV